METVLRPFGSVQLPLLMPATNEQGTWAALPAVYVSGGGRAPNGSFWTLSSGAMVSVVEELAVRLAVFATVAKTVPAAQPMVAVAPNAASLVRLGEYLA